MKLQILVDGAPVEVDADLLNDVVEVEPGVYSILYGGRSYEARVTRSPDGLNVDTGGRRVSAEVVDPRERNRGAKRALGGGRQNITSPMPGKVIRLLVSEGDAVEAGQGLVVVEAMKMQNEVKAARPGKVAEIRVRDGDTVGAGDTLVVLT